jgi:pantoate--beta-alanine ligase
MVTFTNIADLRRFLARERKLGKSIGFVPTMGALHAGHLSLVEHARNENDLAVCSIFVNPAQFNDKSDLEKYPRTPIADVAMLEKGGCDVLFMPPEGEMYPEPDTRKFDFGDLEGVMEGAHRPGHFNGVAVIVSKLFSIVEPDRAYFGQKDFQQLAIVRKMTKDLGFNTTIIGCPIVREADGLAMSSRNVRLDPVQRKEAALIPATLFRIKELAAEGSNISQLKTFVEAAIASNPNMKLDYFEIADTDTLQPVSTIDPEKGAVACIAVKLGPVRLIDNVILNA